jgi:hypothetical protein
MENSMLTSALKRCGRDGGAHDDWVQAYLHRKEGDTSNAHYWYVRAGKPVHSDSLEQEWMAISEA